MRTTLVALMLVILCGVSAAEEAKITLTVKDMPLVTLGREIAKQSKLTVVVDPDRADARITLTLTGVPARQALTRAASAARAQVVRLTSSAVWIGRSLEVWERRLQATLVLSTLNAAFADTFLVKALGFVSSEIGVPVAVDPEVMRLRERDTLALTLKVAKIQGHTLLDLMTQAFDLAWDVRYGVVFVSTKKRLASLPRVGMNPPRAGRMGDGEAKLRRRLAAETVFFDFNGASAASVLRHLSKTRKVPVVLDDDVKAALEESAMVIQKVEGISFQQALDLVLVPRGFRYEPTREGVKILRKR